MSRSHRRAAGSPAHEPRTEAHPSVAPGAEDERRNRQALVDYFRILQEWSLKAQPEGLVGDQHVVSGTPAKIRKRR
jgi:hypothetical protein